MKLVKYGFLCMLLSMILFTGCRYDQDYKYTYTVKVTYTDSSIDTLTFGRDSFKGNEVYVYLKISQNGLLVSGGTSPTLIIACGFYHTIITSGVRKYEILNEIKEPIVGNYKRNHK